MSGTKVRERGLRPGNVYGKGDGETDRSRVSSKPRVGLVVKRFLRSRLEG